MNRKSLIVAALALLLAGCAGLNVKATWQYPAPATGPVAK